MDFGIFNVFESNSGLLWPVAIAALVVVAVWIISWLLVPPQSSTRSNGESLLDLPNVDPLLAARLRRHGIVSFGDVMRLSPPARKDLESRLELPAGQFSIWRSNILEAWRSSYLPAELRGIDMIEPDPHLGGIYVERPPQVDDLSSLDGIEPEVESRLNDAGIYTWQQLRLLTPEQQANVKWRFNLAGFDFDRVPRHGVNATALADIRKLNPLPSRTFDAQAADRSGSSDVESATKAQVAFAAQPSESCAGVLPRSGESANFGRIYTSPPPHRDDLTKLDGIDNKLAHELNCQGIYTIDQLLSLTPNQQDQFKVRFDLPHVDFGKWRSPHSLNESRPLPDGKALPATRHEATRHEAIQSQEVRPTQQEQTQQDINRARLDIGYLFVSPPSKPDDLTTLPGIDERSARRLNLVGIYTFNQLTSMSDDQRQNLQSRFDLPHIDFKDWDETIAGLTSTPSVNVEPRSQDRRSDPNPEPNAVTESSSNDSTQASNVTDAEVEDELSTSRSEGDQPAIADELTQLRRVDSNMQIRLHELGIFSFAQLTSLSDAEQSNLIDKLGINLRDFVDWRRCIYAWNRGVETTPEQDHELRTGWLHGIRLPRIARSVFDGQQLVAYPEQVVFRGSHPKFWGIKVTKPENGVDHSIPAAEVRSDINYVRIRRVDTRDSVVTPITKGQLFSPGPREASCGWNGLCEEFFGGRHLGIFADEVPNEVETTYGMGGWGFGHRFEHNNQQEWAWNGRLIEPTTFEISVGFIGSPSGTVLFRSGDPTIWNTRTREGKDRIALPVDAISHPVSFLRLLRVDTGEAVVVRVTQDELLSKSQNPRLGWYGLNDEFMGGRHLGIYHRDVPQSVEVSFGAGGWGFGHPFGENNRQAYGWAGQPIFPSPVFEISVLAHLPDYLRHELLE